MVCLFCLEIECYGEYFKFGEFIYDCLFFWGFKCIGLDLYCLGNKYLDSWYYNYMFDLISMLLGFIMLVYLWLIEDDLDNSLLFVKIVVLCIFGIFYEEGYEEEVIVDVEK